MLIKEKISDKLVKTYSDEGFMILRVDNKSLYEEAIDPIVVEDNPEDTPKQLEGTLVTKLPNKD